MSYIHEALKKAQEERESLTDKCAAVWARSRGHQRGFKREPVVSACIVVLAVAFSAYSWIQSIDRFPASKPETSPSFYRAQINPSLHLPSDTPSQVKANAHSSAAKRARPSMINQNTKVNMRAISEQRDRHQAPDKKNKASTRISHQGGGATLYKQALALQKQGRLQEAIRLYRAALQRSPDLVSALNNLGAIYIQQKNPSEAQKVLEKAIRQNRNFVDPYYNLACLHAQQKDIGRSLFYLKKAISVNEAARRWANNDEDLKNLRGNVEYEKIIKGGENS